jgi:excisionase family DNA binding protein
MSAHSEYDAQREPRRRETAQISGHELLFTPGEVAQQLRVTAEQVRSLIRAGKLVAINVGTGPKRPLYRITPEALEEFLARRAQQVEPVLSMNRRLPAVPDFFPDLG